MGDSASTAVDQTAAGVTASAGFAHLHLHTEYSLLDGGNRIDRLIARVKELGMGSVAITDHGNMHGAIAFATTAKAAGVKPILGVEAYVAPGDRKDRTATGVQDGGWHLVLLAENDRGWKNLKYLCSEAYLTGFYYKPRIDRGLLETHGSGLIAINGHLGSEIAYHLMQFETTRDPAAYQRAVDVAKWHARVFADEGTGPRFYIELQHHVPEQNAINPHLIRLARELGLPLVCDNDSHFLRAEDHDAHDTLICISTGKAKSEQDRMRYPADLYVKSPGEMRELFEAYGEAGLEALDNTERIAARCHVDLGLGQNHAPMVRVRRKGDDATERRSDEGGNGNGRGSWENLPSLDDPRFGGDLTAWYRAYCAEFEVVPFAVPDGADEAERARLLAEAKQECDAALRLLAEGGMTWRYGAGDAGDDAAARRARLERELGILAGKNISAYFLIVWDFVNWGREHDVPALARGSGVGTMVGYCLGLSNACPVRYGLLFERFTDPDRSEYPDIDIDLCQDGRGAVIDYVRRKYGHVAQIITFGTLKARAAVRDVCRVMEVPLSDADKLAKMIPEVLGMTLDGALEQEADLKSLYESDATVRRVIDNARVIEGQARHASVHAAGVIVATRPLHEIVPLYKQTGADEHEVVTQWDGPTCEKMGLLKMDFLGLRTLSVIERAKRLIREGLSEQEIWRAVGRGEEYEKWQSGKVAKWQSQEMQHGDGEAPDQDLPGPDRVGAEHGSGPRDLSRVQGDAQGRAVRADQPDAPGGLLGADEHRRGVRKAHSPRVPARAPDRDGLALRADDRLRAGDVDEADPGVGVGDRKTRGGRSRAGSADPQARGQAKGSTQSLTNTLNVEAPEGESPALPLCHSATLPLLPPPHPLDLDRLTYDDPKVFDIFQRGDVTGVFQFESGGMRRLLVEMKPDRLEDLIAANALFRPGPMDLIPAYNQRKHGREEVPSIHPIVDGFTAPTYGVMVYQEQVMQIVHELGGIPLRAAYSLIKAISKKKEKDIAKARPVFVEGAASKGLARKQAEELFELILKFAGYGFNKSHSTGYAIVAYQTAYLKTYFPAQYMAAFLTFESQAQKLSDWMPYLEDTRRTRTINPATGEAVRAGLDVRPPDINLSQKDFAVVFDAGEARTAAHGHIRFGLGAIKGAGDKAIEAVIKERDGATERRSDEGVELAPSGAPASPSVASSLDRSVARPFSSLFDFCERLPTSGAHGVNKATIEALVKCGAFDSLHGRKDRASMVLTIDSAVTAGQRLAADKAAGQSQLFGFGGGEPAGKKGKSGGASGTGGDPATESRLIQAEPWSEGETLRQEKETLGFYVTSHPLERWKSWIGVFATHDVGGLREGQQDQRVVVGVLVQSTRTLVSKKGQSAGQKMAILTLEDLGGTCDAVMFPGVYAMFGHLLTDDAPKFVSGKLDLSRGDPQILIDRVAPIETLPLEKGRLRMVIREPVLNGGSLAAIDELKDVVRRGVSGDEGTTPTTRARPAAPRPVEEDFGNPQYPLVPLELVIETSDAWYELKPESGSARLAPALATEAARILGVGSLRLRDGVPIEAPGQGQRRRFGKGD